MLTVAYIELLTSEKFLILSMHLANLGMEKRPNIFISTVANILFYYILWCLNLAQAPLNAKQVISKHFVKNSLLLKVIYF